MKAYDIREDFKQILLSTHGKKVSEATPEEKLSAFRQLREQYGPSVSLTTIREAIPLSWRGPVPGL